MVAAALRSRLKELARTIRKSRERVDFHIDSLESRQMLTGNVSVFVNTAGDITIVGDAAGNEFTLDSDDGAGGTNLVITGNNGTTISFNGSTAASQTISLATDSTVAGRLRIFTKGGDDIVTLQDTDVSEHLLIKTKAGDDSIILQNVTVSGLTRLRSKLGNDDVQIQDSDIDGEARISLGTSADTVSFGTDVVFATNVTISGGRGADSYDGFSSNFTVAPDWVSMETRATIANAIADQAATEGSPFAFSVPLGGFAAAGDTPTLTARQHDGSALPTWLSFDGATFSGTPADADVGTVSVTVTATDATTGTVSVSDTFDINVSDINNAPTVANPIPNQTATVGMLFSFSVPGNTFDDLDASDTLTLTATLPNGSDLPTWLTFDGTTFSGTPAVGDIGTITVRVTATDDAASPLSVFDEFDIVVSPAT